MDLERPPRIICLVTDRLRAAAIGSYGAAWCETPAFDQLASQSLLFDQVLTPAQTLAGLYRQLWQGAHPLEPAAGTANLPRLLRAAGYRTTLLTDEPQLTQHPLAAEFDEQVHLPAAEVTAPARRMEETQLARLSAATLEMVSAAERADRGAPRLLWIHSRGMAGPWDAPLELRNSLLDEDDPPPPQTTSVPSWVLPEDFDPDLPLGLTQAYTAQIMTLDACLAALLDQLQGRPLGEQTLLIVLGGRGFPLGEHRRVGAAEEILYGEMVHLPLMIRFPHGLGRLTRSDALVQPSDLFATLLDCVGQRIPAAMGSAASLLPLARDEQPRVRDRLCLTTSSGQLALRTAAWHAIFAESGDQVELYTKPDDRWEFNDVASRLPDVVSGLRTALAQFQQAAQAGQLASLPPLDESLE